MHEPDEEWEESTGDENDPVITEAEQPEGEGETEAETVGADTEE